MGDKWETAGVPVEGTMGSNGGERRFSKFQVRDTVADKVPRFLGEKLETHLETPWKTQQEETQWEASWKTSRQGSKVKSGKHMRKTAGDSGRQGSKVPPHCGRHSAAHCGETSWETSRRQGGRQSSKRIHARNPTASCCRELTQLCNPTAARVPTSEILDKQGQTVGETRWETR